MTRKQKRLFAVLFLVCGFGAATTFTLLALRDNISYFRTPSEVASGNYPEHASGRAFRLGGLVVKGSLKREGDVIIFEVTDLKQSIAVEYRGIPPDLFREGQGVVAEGKMTPENVFVATLLLAKHDEKYMPPEIARTLQASPLPSSDPKSPPTGPNP